MKQLILLLLVAMLTGCEKSKTPPPMDSFLDNPNASIVVDGILSKRDGGFVFVGKSDGNLFALIGQDVEFIERKRGQSIVVDANGVRTEITTVGLGTAAAQKNMVYRALSMLIAKVQDRAKRR